eukprot:jgi/Mesvir1/2212/Mv09857-RA.1
MRVNVLLSCRPEEPVVYGVRHAADFRIEDLARLIEKKYEYETRHAIEIEYLAINGHRVPPLEFVEDVIRAEDLVIAHVVGYPLSTDIAVGWPAQSSEAHGLAALSTPKFCALLVAIVITTAILTSILSPTTVDLNFLPYRKGRTEIQRHGQEMPGHPVHTWRRTSADEDDATPRSLRDGWSMPAGTGRYEDTDDVEPEDKPMSRKLPPDAPVRRPAPVEAGVPNPRPRVLALQERAGTRTPTDASATSSSPHMRRAGLAETPSFVSPAVPRGRPVPSHQEDAQTVAAGVAAAGVPLQVPNPMPSVSTRPRGHEPMTRPAGVPSQTAANPAAGAVARAPDGLPDRVLCAELPLVTSRSGTHSWPSVRAPTWTSCCVGCNMVLSYPPDAVMLGRHAYPIETGASGAIILMAHFGDGRPPAFVKFICVPGVQVTSSYIFYAGKTGVDACKQKAQAGNYMLLNTMSVERMAAECGLDDLSVRSWTEQVYAAQPRTNALVDQQGVFSTAAPGVSLNSIMNQGMPRMSFEEMKAIADKMNGTKILRAAVFDVLFSNVDRHPGNVFVTESGHMTLIDNDQVFGTINKAYIDSVFIPTTDRHAVGQRGGKGAFAKALDYRCHAKGGKLGFDYPPSVERCMQRFSRMSPEELMHKYGMTSVRHAAAVQERSTQLLTLGFEATIEKVGEHQKKTPPAAWPARAAYSDLAWPRPRAFPKG